MRCSDTAQLFFEDVRVPAKNVIGEEGMGFTYQMLQFQEERLYAAAVGKREGWATHTRCCSSRRRDFTLQLWVRHNLSCSQKKKTKQNKKTKKKQFCIPSGLLTNLEQDHMQGFPDWLQCFGFFRL